MFILPSFPAPMGLLGLGLGQVKIPKFIMHAVDLSRIGYVQLVVATQCFVTLVNEERLNVLGTE